MFRNNEICVFEKASGTFFYLLLIILYDYINKLRSYSV